MRSTGILRDSFECSVGVSSKAPLGRIFPPHELEPTYACDIGLRANQFQKSGPVRDLLSTDPAKNRIYIVEAYNDGE